MTAVLNSSLIEVDEIASGLDSYIKNNHVILNSNKDSDVLDYFHKNNKKMNAVYISIEDFINYFQETIGIKESLFKNIYESSDIQNWILDIVEKSKKILTDSGVFILHVKDIHSLGFREILSKTMLEKNYVSTFVWDNMKKNNNFNKKINNTTEYFYVYAKDIDNFNVQQKKISVLNDSSYNLQDEFLMYRGKYKLVPLDSKSFDHSKEKSKPFFLNGIMCFAGGSEKEHRKNEWTWIWDSAKIKDRYEKGFIVLKKDSKNNFRIYKKQYQLVDDLGEPIERKVNFNNIILDISNSSTKKEYESITGKKCNSLVAKDVLKYILKATTDSESTILNLSAFFGTLSASVMEMNYDEHSSRTVYNSFSSREIKTNSIRLALDLGLLELDDVKDRLQDLEDIDNIYSELDTSEIVLNKDFVVKYEVFSYLIKYLSGKNPLAKPTNHKNIVFCDSTISVFNLIPNDEDLDLFDISKEEKNKVLSHIKFNENLHYKKANYFLNDSITVITTLEYIYIVVFIPQLSNDALNIIKDIDSDNILDKEIKLYALDSVLSDIKLQDLNNVKTSLHSLNIQ